MLLLKDTILEKPYLAVTCITGLVLVIWHCLDPSKSSSCRTRSPPRVPYWLPWIGSAIEMGKDPDVFFERASSKLGPLFRVKTLGKEINYVTSPDLISAIYRDSKVFEFTPIRLGMSETVFSMSHAATYSSSMVFGYLPLHHRALSPQNITSLLQRYGFYAHECVQEAINKLDGQSSPLLPFISPSVYNSASYAFFGRAFDAKVSYRPFQTFDKQFPLLAAGLPKFMMFAPHRAWSQVVKLFEQYLEGSHEDCSDLVSEVISCTRDGNWTELDVARSLAIELWALQANSVNAAYWVLALELQKPRGLSALVAEIDGARLDWKARKSSQSNTNQYQWVIDTPLPLLTSAIREALRYSTSAFSIRIVRHPVDFAGFHFEKGERIVCVTRSVHLDEEIHPKATEFVTERYLQGQSKFSKKGKPVPNHSMPFGGGMSMCEGRHFAIGELKMYLVMLLSYATIELDPSSMSRPKLLTARMGVGVMPPAGDLLVKIHRRTDV